jgi:3-deoxy-7-phosphoheptulonate synthase
MIEVHCTPELALCDGDESLTPETFKLLMADLARLAPHFGRKISTIETTDLKLADQGGQK